MASLALATTRSLSLNGWTQTSSPVLASFIGNGMKNFASGGLQTYKFRFPRAAAVTVSSNRLLSSTVDSVSTIKVGDKLPEAELAYIDKDDNVQTVKLSELTEGKKVVLFGTPGAFSSTCSQKHLPAFLAKADELKAKGIDTIAGVSVNDVFVLKEWASSLGVGDKILLLSDGNLNLTKALGVEWDNTGKPVGLGVRSRRYSLLAEDGVVKQLNLEDGGAYTISGPDSILKTL